MSRSVLWLSALLVAGCAGGEEEEDDPTTDTGSGSIFPPGQPVGEVWEYAGISGNRSWTYSRTDSAQLIVDDSGATTTGTTTTNLLTYVADDAEQQLYEEHTMDWAAGPEIGIEIRSYDGTPFNNPVRLADPDAFIGDVITTQALGTFTATLVGFEDCPNSWSDKWTCLHIEVTGGSGEYFVGDWWLADGWGAAIFQPASQPHPWVLRQTNVIE